MTHLLSRLGRPMAAAFVVSAVAFAVAWTTGPSARPMTSSMMAGAVAPAGPGVVPEPAPTVDLAAKPAPSAAPSAAAQPPGRPRSAEVDDDGLAGRASSARTTAPVRSGPETMAQRRTRLLSMVQYNWRALDFSVVFAGPRDGLLGLTDPQDRTITVYVRSGQSDRSLLDTLAHEIGHAVDITYGTKARRDEYLRLRGIPSAPWWPCGSCSDYASGAGDFAEVFAVWVVGSHSFSSQLAGRPSATQLRAMRHLFTPDPVAVAAAAAEAKAAAAVAEAQASAALVPSPPAGAPPVVATAPTAAPAPAYLYPQPVRSPYTWTFSYPTYDGTGTRRTRR